MSCGMVSIPSRSSVAVSPPRALRGRCSADRCLREPCAPHRAASNPTRACKPAKRRRVVMLSGLATSQHCVCRQQHGPIAADEVEDRPRSFMVPGSQSVLGCVRTTRGGDALSISCFRHCSTDPRWGQTITTDWPTLHAMAMPVSVFPAPQGKTTRPPCTELLWTTLETAFSW